MWRVKITELSLHLFDLRGFCSLPLQTETDRFLKSSLPPSVLYCSLFFPLDALKRHNFLSVYISRTYTQHNVLTRPDTKQKALNDSFVLTSHYTDKFQDILVVTHRCCNYYTSMVLKSIFLH